MAKKSNRKDYEQAKKAADYYELKTQAVDDLVNTNVTNAPKVSEAERAKYRTRSRLNIPMWGKAVLLKWWLAGIVCWFFIFGLAIGNTLDQLVIAGIGLGVACVIEEFSHEPLESGRLFRLELTEPVPRRSVGACWLTGIALSTAARRFIELVKAGK